MKSVLVWQVRKSGGLRTEFDRQKQEQPGAGRVIQFPAATEQGRTLQESTVTEWSAESEAGNGAELVKITMVSSGFGEIASTPAASPGASMCMAA